MSQTPDLESAAAEVQRLVSCGWEYPDASAKVAMATGLTTEAIGEAYDAANERGQA